MANKPGVDVTERRRVLRLVENLTMGRNAVGYLTESMHGAGSPLPSVVIQKLAKMEEKRGFARRLAGCGGHWLRRRGGTPEDQVMTVGGAYDAEAVD